MPLPGDMENLDLEKDVDWKKQKEISELLFRIESEEINQQPKMFSDPDAADQWTKAAALEYMSGNQLSRVLQARLRFNPRMAGFI